MHRVPFEGDSDKHSGAYIRRQRACARSDEPTTVSIPQSGCGEAGERDPNIANRCFETDERCLPVAHRWDARERRPHAGAVLVH